MKTQQTITFHKSKLQLNFLSIREEGWFTLIEIITSIAILAVITILWVTYTNNYKLTQYNTLRASDIDTLNNTMQSYYETNKKYPLPAWNRQYFDEYWVYTHANTWSYWVSWFITSQTFGKEFTLVTQKDPITKYYYAYARTLDNKPAFQFATSLDKKWTYYWYVKWIYSNNNLAWIVREYNWPNFVINNSSKYLPYNPHELKLTGNIISYSWTILVNNDASQTSKELEQSDTITVTTWSLATINLSDWSELRLWSTIRSSTLNLNTLSYKEDDNLLTKISLKLTLWEVWVKAPQLEDWSEFSLETDNAAASVRWTVFWMTTDGNGSWSINLIEGKLQIYSILNNTMTEDFSWVTSATGAIRVEPLATWWTGTFMDSSLSTNGVVLNYSTVAWTDQVPVVTSLTWTVSQTTEDNIMKPQVKMKSSYIPRILSFNKDSSNIWTIKFTNNWGNYYRFKAYNGTHDWLSQQIADDRTLLDNDVTLPITKTWSIDSVSQSVYLTWLYLSWKNELALQICDKNTNVSTAAENHDNLNCSSWAILWFSLTSPIAITEDSTQKQEILKEKALWCPEWQQFSDITNHCEQSWLVAYAWYDIPGDIFMSIGNDNILSTNTNNVVTATEFNPNYVVRNKADVWLLLSWASWYNNQQLSPTIRLSWTWAFSDTVFTNADNPELDNTGWYISYDRKLSYFELPRIKPSIPRGWIYLDKNASGYPDYLKYNISPLQLSWPFTIEMSVRWAALKRTTGTGILFSIPNPSDSSKYLYLANRWGLFKFWYSSLSAWFYYIANSPIRQLDKLDNNSFYIVKILYKQSLIDPTTDHWIYPYHYRNFEMSIKNKDWSDIIPFNINKFPYAEQWWNDKNSFFTPQQIYIGSDPSGNNQWNDIIDWVKIYKN